jgi:hypothetical protein
MIPKTTDPLAKFIRTGEGILVFGLNLVLLIVPIVSNSLTAAESAKWAAVIDTIAVISRSGLKAIATLQNSPGSTSPEQLAADATRLLERAGVDPTVAAGAVSAVSSAAEVTLAPAPVSAPAQLSAGAPAPPPEIEAAPDDADPGQAVALVTDAEEFADAPPPAGEVGLVPSADGDAISTSVQLAPAPAAGAPHNGAEPATQPFRVRL